MKKTIRFKGLAFILVTTAVLSGCSQGQRTNAQDQEVAQEHPNVVERDAPVFGDEQLAAAYEHYLRLKDALVASDKEEAATAAAALKTALQNVSEAGNVAQAAASIAAATEIEAQRTNFSELSDRMTDLVETSEITSGGIYLAFCPMANDGQGGYWLTNEQEIRNPYYGAKMMKCGTVKKTIR